MQTTLPTAVEPTPAQKAQTILQKSCCLVLRCGYIGNYRKVNLDGLDIEKDGEEMNGEKKEMNATKRLFSSKDLKPCNNAVESVKTQLRAISVSGAENLFGAGAYMIPNTMVPKAITIINEGKALLEEVKADLKAKLPELLEQRKMALGKLFVVSEYPTAEDIQSSARIDFNFVSFGAPDALQDVDVAVAEAAQADWDRRLAEEFEKVVVGLRQAALTVMKELADRLRPDADGKPKTLRGTALRDLQDLLGRLPALNITGDDPLTAVMARVGAVAKDLDVDMLKKSDAVRGMLLQTAQQAIDQLDGLVQKAGRGITLDGSF